MSAVNSVSNLGALSQTSAGAGTASGTATKSEFMNLFVAQLRNQNPLSPQDPSAFVAQLAQMTQLEQTVETNSRLEAMATEQAASRRADLAALVGRQVSATGGDFRMLDNGEVAPDVVVKLGQATTQAGLDVVDGAGRVVRHIDLGARSAGAVVVAGSALAGLTPGSYQLRASGKNGAGADVGGSVSLSGVLTALELGPDGERFRMGSFSISPASVDSVGAQAPTEVK